MRSSRDSVVAGSVRRAVSRLDGWPRRAAAATCFLIAVVSFVGSHPHGATRALWVADRNLPAGSIVQSADISRTAWPANLVPAVAVTSAADIVGRPIAVALARGEPLTSTRMLDTSVLAGLRAGQVAAPVTLPDRGQRALLQVGAVVDLYASASNSSNAAAADCTARTPAARSTSRPIVSNVRLLAVLSQPEGSSDSRLTALVAVDRNEASRLADHGSTEMIATLVPPQ